MYEPKGVVSGFNDQGKKVLMAPIEKLNRISKGKANPVNIKDLMEQKNFNASIFLGYYAIHSVAKMAYEWYCYFNNIEKYQVENHEIVDYILGKSERTIVELVIDSEYEKMIEQISEFGTNLFFQYDDNDGYRYVVFDFWKIFGYRVRISKVPKDMERDLSSGYAEVFLYHLDGSKEKRYIKLERNIKFQTISTEKISGDLWKKYSGKIAKLLETIVLTINTIKNIVDTLSIKLEQYNRGNMDIANLLAFEDRNTIGIISIIDQLYTNKEKYDTSKSFNENMNAFNSNNDTITSTKERDDIVFDLVNMHKSSKLYLYLSERIKFFNEIYETEMRKQ